MFITHSSVIALVLPPELVEQNEEHTTPQIEIEHPTPDKESQTLVKIGF